MKKKIMLKLSVIALILILSFPWALNVSAADYTTTELETFGNLDNDSFARAESVLTTPLSSSSCSYVNGILGNSPSHIGDPNADEDFYKIYVTSTTGNKGRFAIKLENIPAGCNYDILLYDVNQAFLGSSTRAGTANEILRTPEITSSTTYYVRIIPATGTTVNPSAYYRLKLESTVVTVTSTFTATPTYLNSIGTARSNSGSVDLRTRVPADALVRKITVSATKSTSNQSYNYIMYVSSALHPTWESGAWNGEITAFTIADPTRRARARDMWYIAFSATPINPAVLNATTISNAQIIMTYEYDTAVNY